jgi:adenylate cyclase
MVSCWRARRLVPWHGASSDTFSLGTSVLSTLAETADFTNLRGEAAGRAEARQDTLKFAEAALAENKREGLLLAVRARWVALAVTAVTLPIVNPNWDVIYYVLMLSFFALIGWAQLKVGKVGRSPLEVFLIICDLALLTFLSIVPNPWSNLHWPIGMQFRFDSFIYFFIFLSTATLAFSWRTVLGMGMWTSALWAVAVGWAYLQPESHAALSDRVREAVGADIRMFEIIDPSAIGFGARFQQVTVFVIVAAILALMVRRSNALLVSHAGIERERANLARYFSPNVVKELSGNDEPLTRVRTQDVAVLFADIVGFTAFADGRDPKEVIGTLRQFHERMEREVFRHGGTLDKYLGDGLMATFGTPFTGDADALNALRCARGMIASTAELNKERSRRNEPPIQVSVGLHYGQVVLGDIGLNQLEFAVIGTTVNAASRLESLTREFGCAIVVSDALVRQARAGSSHSSADFALLVEQPEQIIRGLEQPVGIWTCANAAP